MAPFCRIICALLVLGSTVARGEDLTVAFARLPAVQQRAVLADLIRNADYRCDTVERHYLAGGGNGREAWWDVECSRTDTGRRASYRMRIQPQDAPVEIAPCDIMERAAQRAGKRVACFEPVFMPTEGGGRRKGT